MKMSILQLNSYPNLNSTLLNPCQTYKFTTKSFYSPLHHNSHFTFTPGNNVKPHAVETTVEGVSTENAEDEEPPSIDFAFVGSRLLPDGSPDIAIRSACGGQKLRDIMLASHIDLYGPYDKPLSNCAGGGTCATCIVEVVEGKELLSKKTDKEKEKLKRNPKTWRLACQTVVGDKDSRGQVVIQQLPEWKAHEWE